MSFNIKFSKVNRISEYTEKQKDTADLKSTMNQLNTIKIYTIFTQQQSKNSVPVLIDYKLGDSGTYPGT